MRPTTWSDVLPGDIILGRDGNHYVVIARANGIYSLFRKGEVHTVASSDRFPVAIVNRPEANALAALADGGLVSRDEIRRSILDSLRRPQGAATQQEAGF